MSRVELVRCSRHAHTMPLPDVMPTCGRPANRAPLPTLILVSALNVPQPLVEVRLITSRLSVVVSSFSQATTQVLPLIATTWWNESPAASSAALWAPNVVPPLVETRTWMSRTPLTTVWYVTTTRSGAPGRTAMAGLTLEPPIPAVTLTIVPQV